MYTLSLSINNVIALGRVRWLVHLVDTRQDKRTENYDRKTESVDHLTGIGMMFLTFRNLASYI